MILVLDKKGGINRGDINIHECDNKNEIYEIQLMKNGEPYNLTGKTIHLAILEKISKQGEMLELPILDAVTGKIKLEIISDITKVDGAFDFQITVKDQAGLIDTFPSFRVDIKNNISADVVGQIVGSQSFAILNEALAKVTEWDQYFTETSGKIEKIESDLEHNTTQLEEHLASFKMVELQCGAEVLQLPNDKYQTCKELNEVNYIYLPVVNEFTEIHLFLSINDNVPTLILPSIKWQTQPNISANKDYEFVFTFTDKWLGGVIQYE